MMKYIKIFSKDNIYFIKFNEIMYKIHNNSLNLMNYFFYGNEREKGRLGFGRSLREPKPRPAGLRLGPQVLKFFSYAHVVRM